MKRAIIFANGSMTVPPPIIDELDASDLIIAADGGTRHCKALGIKPNVIVGDFDSLGHDEVSTYESQGVEMIKFPRDKNETDLELALQYASTQAVSQVFILAALGNRWDMTVANILLAANSKFSHMAILLLDGMQELSILQGKGQFDIDDKKGAILSLIPIGSDALGVTTHGLEYPLSDESLFFSSPRGVSNVILDNHAYVRIKQGSLLVCISR
jgi:thiamine pyrophosphokinase